MNWAWYGFCCFVQYSARLLHPNNIPTVGRVCRHRSGILSFVRYSLGYGSSGSDGVSSKKRGWEPWVGIFPLVVSPRWIR